MIVVEPNKNGNAMGGWEEKFISLANGVLWSASYFSVEGGTINCDRSVNSPPGRFSVVADLSGPGVG